MSDGSKTNLITYGYKDKILLTLSLTEKNFPYKCLLVV